MHDFQTLDLQQHLQSFWRADPDCPVWLWAERNIILSPMESADMAGPFSSAVTPFIREPLECFRDDSVHDLTLLFATQVCKTLMIMLGVAWWLDNHAGRCIWVMDTESNARSFSETRWQPLLRDCQSLAAQIGMNKEDFKKLQQRVGQSLIHFVGSNSPGNLASRPGDLAVMDEVDKFAVTTEREANAVDLVEQRTKSRANTMVVKTSSPTTEYGLIWLSFLSGDQRQYLVACPHCKNFILLGFDHVRWDREAKIYGKWNYEQVRNTARYYCQHCGGTIHDGMKTAMLRSGKWEPTNPHAAPGVRSYQLTSLYSPWAKTTFGNLAVEFLKHKARFDMKGWDNGYMAVPSKEQAIELNWEKLSKRRDPSPEIPEWAAFITAFQDTQDSWLEWGAIAWGENLEHAVIEHERIIVDPSDMENWEPTRELIERDRFTKSGRMVPLLWAFLDFGGHHQTEVINFVRSMRGYPVHASFGSKTANMPAKGRVTKTKSKPRHRLFEIGVSEAKKKIFSFMQRTKPGRGYCHFLAASLDADEGKRPLDDAYFMGLCAERLEPRQVGRSTELVWVQVRDRNEPLDIHVGCYCGLLQIPQSRRVAAIKEMLEATGKKRVAVDKVVEADDADAEHPIEDPIDRRKRVRAGKRRTRGDGGRRGGRGGGGFATSI